MKTPISIRKSREAFINKNKLTSGQVAEAIERSWRRCLSNQIGTTAPDTPVVITAESLAERKAQNRLLISHAEPEMATLSEQIAHTRSIVILTDNDGIILKSMGDHSFVSKDEKIALSPGASWNEKDRGTNAIGTALIEQSALTVQGAEHYMATHHNLSCAAVPIFGAQQELLGTLDVSNDNLIPQQHTLALVKMAAQMVENRLFKSAHQADIVVHFHSRAEFIGTLWEGIAIFDADGQFIAINRSGQFQLNLDLAAFKDQSIHLHFNQLFDTSLQTFKQRDQQASAFITPTTLSNGARVYVRVEFSTDSGTHSAPQPTARTYAPSNAANLDLLNSGDPQLAKAIKQVKKVLHSDIPIVIQGETGVGKDVFSRAIHEAGPRSAGPWIAVNCAALPEGLIESELFGYEEGAFTGAKRKGSQGKLVQANGGTLFLDEIGDMPQALQARLLRVLQDRSVTPLGGTQAIDVDFTLVSATNQNLKEKVSNGSFRADLYYRINGLTISLPALRTRTDLTAIIKLILQIEQATEVSIDTTVMQTFAEHPWPGNIRQLHNVLRTAIALCDDNNISLTDLTQDFLDEMQVDTAEQATTTIGAVTDTLIQRVMQQHAGNVSAAARTLGISRNTLYRRLKEINLV